MGKGFSVAQADLGSDVQVSLGVGHCLPQKVHTLH
jgi:hypothetical protein